MKRVPLILSYGLLLACGSPTSPAQQQGTILFKMDNVSCLYAGTKNVTFYIATLDVGTEAMISGATSTGYLTKATSAYTRSGNPVVQARVENYTPTGGALWTARISLKVPVNGSVTHTITC
jgi:hypothetical protein